GSRGPPACWWRPRRPTDACARAVPVGDAIRRGAGGGGTGPRAAGRAAGAAAAREPGRTRRPRRRVGPGPAEALGDLRVRSGRSARAGVVLRLLAGPAAVRP